MKTISVFNGNLFRIAAQHLNDANAWDKIAQINKLDSPLITGFHTLILPDDTTESDSVRR